FGESTFAVVDGTFNVNAAKSPAIEIFGRQGTLSFPGDYDGGGREPFFELFRLDAVPGLDGWITPRQGSLAAAERRFQALERACVIEHAVDCIRSHEHPILSAEHARHALEIMLKSIDAARAGLAMDL